MPFSWTALPQSVSKALAKSAGLRQSYADVDLAEAYGEPPDERVVQEHWPVLRDRWLASRPTERSAVVGALRASNLGNTSISVATKAGQMDYLRSCRNSQSLRTTVLDALVEACEFGDTLSGTTDPEQTMTDGLDKDPFELVKEVLLDLTVDQAGHLEFYLFCAIGEAVADSLDAGVAAEDFAVSFGGAVFGALVSAAGDDDPYEGPSSPHLQQVASGTLVLATDDGVASLFRAIYGVGLNVHRDLSDDAYGALVNSVVAVIGLLATGVGPVDETLYSSIHESVVSVGEAIASDSDDPVSEAAAAGGPALTEPDQGELPTLKEQVLESLETMLGRAPQIDEDGDIPFPRGSALVWLRTVEEPDAVPEVTLFASLVLDVQCTPQLLESLNEINAQMKYGRTIYSEGRVSLRLRMPAEVVTDSQIYALVDDATAAADYFDSALVRKFGGRTWLGEPGDYVDA
jgi:hypothetical protein